MMVGDSDDLPVPDLLIESSGNPLAVRHRHQERHARAGSFPVCVVQFRLSFHQRAAQFRRRNISEAFNIPCMEIFFAPYKSLFCSFPAVARRNGTLEGRVVSAAALQNDLPEQRFLFHHCTLEFHTDTTGGLSEQRHPLRVTAERRNVAPYPTQGGCLVHQPVISAAALLRDQPGMAEKAHHSQTVIHRHQHDAPPGVFGAVKLHLVTAAVGKGAAVDPHRNGKPFFR